MVGLAIDQIAQSGLSSLSVIYYSAHLFSKDVSMTQEEADQRLIEKLQLEAKWRAEKYAAVVAEYMRKKIAADLLPPKQRHRELKAIITKETITSIGEQLRTCRIFVSDMVIRSIAVGARIQNGGKVYAISNGILRQTTVNDAGNKDRPTTEYMAANYLVTRWNKAAKQKVET
ncbi:hypothetical protein AB185_24420 [Klebsiella oxytoca]|nr:hypothetical protein AB185_24420 [Klebsiella oxytoca]